jgi:hypothetical protein
MDDSSVTRSTLLPTKAIVADEGFCAQVAALLMCDRGPIHDAFIGEPAEEVLEMVRWALKHEQDEGFDQRRRNHNPPRRDPLPSRLRTTLGHSACSGR